LIIGTTKNKYITPIKKTTSPMWLNERPTRFIFSHYVYPRHPAINDGQDGNYIYAKKNAEGRWVPVYIGEGALAMRATPDHHRIKCIDSKGATHVHLRLNSNKDVRRAEETDLLANYTNALAPNGCNLNPTG
jgi:hypothetical protein